MLKFISALNSLNTPWVAICVIILGMSFDVVCKIYGVSNDAATGVIGAGIGLLTGQALSKSQQTQEPMSSILPPESEPKN
jgi:flagellar biosynthesis protein FliR